MRNEENICQCCMKKRAITTSSLNGCGNQMQHELSYLLTNCIELASSNLMLTQYKQVQAKTTSTNLTWLYFYLHISIRIFCNLFICFVLDGLLQSICFGHYQTVHQSPLTSTHPPPTKIIFPPTPTENNAPATPTHPHPPKIMPHTPPLTSTHPK